MSESTSEADFRLKELELKRYEARLNFWKAIVISGVVALLIAGLNHQISLRELNIEQEKTTRTLDREKQKTENAYLAQFLTEALGDNLERRVRFAHYFYTLTDDGKVRDRWKIYYDQLNDEFVVIQKKIQERDEELTMAKAETDVNKEKVAKLEAEIARLKADIRPSKDIRQTFIPRLNRTKFPNTKEGERELEDFENELKISGGKVFAIMKVRDEIIVDYYPKLRLVPR